MITRSISALGAEFNEITETLEALGRAVTDQMRALRVAETSHNMTELRAIVGRDKGVDDLELKVDRLCKSFIEKRAPIGPDFRFIMGAMDIGRSLERIGDCIEYVARHYAAVPKLSEEFPEAFHLLDSMVEHCLLIIEKAHASWHRSDVKLALQVPELDDFVDAMQEKAYSLIIQEVRANKVDIELGMMVVLMANKLESIADVACHIAKTVVFMLQAKQVRHSKLGKAGGGDQEAGS